MQLRHALTSCLLALCCVAEVSGQGALQRRQDNTDLTTTAQSTATSSPANTISASASADSEDEPTISSRSSVVSTSQSSSKTTSTNTEAPQATTSSLNTGAAIAHSTPSASSGYTETLPSVLPGALPLEPIITPAVGIAGVVLIAAGIALCLIGIKHEWLYIFLSTALLGSLAVTVLIIYVMSPPVSDAVQGAFLVAAVVTGLIFGAVSLLFKEVTDNLGCLLGGFCFAMWLLVLAPGGIIDSTAGRGILIGLLCAGAFALSFSHYTRTYSLIVCTSFSGATATIVGVDCFSRAGLKEFWIYLWDLNNDEFPIATNTYPITRGIKVEIACTIILFVFGVMSQFKIWKIIKQRRTKREEERLRQKHAREQEEIAVGRDIEAANTRDLAAWEATYGDKDVTDVNIDSGIGSSRSTSKQSGSFKDRSNDGFELVEHVGSQNGRTDDKDKSRPLITVREASSDWAGAATSQDDLLRSASMSRPQSRQSTIKSSYPVSEISVSVHNPGEDGQTFAAGAPPVPPLPFKVPADGDASGDGSMVSGVPHTHQSDLQHAGELNKPSLSRFLELHSRQEDKRASSVAAVADDDDNGMTLSRAASLEGYDAENTQAVETSALARSRSASPAKDIEVVEEDDEEAMSRPVTASVSKIPGLHSRHGSATSLESLHSKRKIGSVSETVVEQLPPQLSRIAQTYRTNEWAKHIADADVPQAEEADAHSPGVHVDTAFAQEAAKPVDVEDLQRFTMAPPQDPAVRSNSRASASPIRESKSQTVLSRTSSTQSTAQRPSLNSRTSLPSFSRQSSSASTNQLAVAPTYTRNTPTPLASQPLVESPIEDTLAEYGPYRHLSSYRSSSATLMDKRHNQLKQRPTTTSFNAPPSAISQNPHVNLITPSNASTAPDHPQKHKRHNSDTISLHSVSQALAAEDEDMTLAQRRDLVQQHRRLSNPQQPPKHLLTSTHPPLPTLPVRSSTYGANPTAETLAFDSHQPQRGSAAPSALTQSKRLTEWRQSFQPQKSTPNLSAASRKAGAMESEARVQLLAQQRQAEWVEQKKKGEREKRESAMESAMRNGALHGAHRDALRRMQAKARDSAGQ